MEVKQQKVVSRFSQVLTFLDTNTSLIPPATVATQRQTIQSAITQINAFAQDQIVKGSETVLSQTQSSARTALRDTYMRQLSTVGLHSLTGKNAGDPSVPGAVTIFTLPTTRTNALTLITAAKAMVAAATPYVSIFTAAGVSLDAVNAAIQALQAAADTENNAKRISKGATQGIVAQIKAAQGAVRLVDVAIRPLIASNKAIVTQWASVKRSTGGPNLGAPTSLPPASAAAATAAASTATSASTSTAAASSTPTASPAPAAAA